MPETTNPQPAVEERVARHLAAKEWLTTEDGWNTATASFRADYLAHAREVIALVLPATPAAVPSALADQTALREQIAAAIHSDLTTHGARRDQGLLGIVPRLTDVVLAVLPPAADRPALSDTERQFLTYALDLAADQMASRGNEFGNEDTAALETLRRMADEAQQPETQAEVEVSWQIQTQWHDGEWRIWLVRDEREDAVADFERVRDDKHAWRLMRFATTATVEAEHTPAA